GTGIDPLEIVEAHGADATRYGLLKMSSAQDVRFSDGAVEEGRKLANKLWNVARLILSNSADAQPEARPREVEERWILARLDATRAEVERAFAAFEFSRAANALYHRSKVRIDVTGENARIFQAVVRPTGDGQGDVEAERERVRAEKQRAERKLADEKFVRNAPPDVVDGERRKLAQYESELDALG